MKAYCKRPAVPTWDWDDTAELTQSTARKFDPFDIPRLIAVDGSLPLPIHMGDGLRWGPVRRII